MQAVSNFWASLPDDLEHEVIDTLLDDDSVRIERIVSHGQSSPEQGWYDQTQSEWVMVVKGAAVLAFDDGREVRLESGDHINLPAGCRHRVAWTDPDQKTVWLAVFY
ncbi:cupin domain-containing protein [Ferrimonas pelagia]